MAATIIYNEAVMFDIIPYNIQETFMPNMSVKISMLYMAETCLQAQHE